MRTTAVLIALAVTASTLHAQRPGGWQVRFDRAPQPDSAFKIEQMGPGWHIYTNSRGSGIAWRPNQSANGNFKAEAELILFPAAGAHAEGFGLIFGGLNLNADNQSYYYFLVNKDGKFLLKHRAGAEVHDLVPWTTHAAIARQTGTAEAKNILAVEAGQDSVLFLVNNQRVHALPRASTPVAGLVGLRVNHGVSVHAARVAVVPR
jgi:hypothetical protein